MRLLYLVLGASACAPLATPRAIISPAPSARTTGNAVLAMPAACESEDSLLCSPAAYYTERTANLAPRGGFEPMIESIVRLKLELAGYMLIDSRTLRLETAERTETTFAIERSGTTSPPGTSAVFANGPTVDSLSPQDRRRAAMALGLSGEISTTLRIRRDGHRVRFDLEIAMRGLPEGTLLWTATCSEIEEEPQATAELVAGCAADGVLAWRAPDAVIGGVL